MVFEVTMYILCLLNANLFDEWYLTFVYILSTGATLIFDVELLSVGDQAPTTNVFKEIDQDRDKQLSRDEVSDYLKKQMAAAEGAEGGDDIKQMMSDHEKLVEEIFQHEDKDKNGFISHDEFTGPKHDEL